MDSVRSPHVVLFGILDWGMGHATRSAPWIAQALAEGHRVHVASGGTALAWLRHHFAGQGVTFHEKPGAVISYARRGTLLRIAAQMPGFLRSVREEGRWTAQLVRSQGITHILSDNCYGVRAPGVRSVLVTHQLHLPVPALLRPWARRVVRGWCGGFEEVWVPDVGEGWGWSGRLSRPALHPVTRYVGVISRLAASAPADLGQPGIDLGQPGIDLGTAPRDAAGPFDTVALISGPEPHRTLMEEGLREGLQRRGKPALLIVGKPQGGSREDGCVTTWYNPPTPALKDALLQARCRICRAGYSTVLDLAALGLRAHLVPTPGQPEQTYLARFLAREYGWTELDQKGLRRGIWPETTGPLSVKIDPVDHAPNATARSTFNNWLQ